MDKESLVKSDLEIGGLVLDALSRARIPVTLCEWDYVPQLDEWQLVIATPWVDTLGPHEANARVLQALSRADIYQKVPVRRLFVRSPRDPIVKSLEAETKTKTEGAIHIIREDQNHPTFGARYSLFFAPFTGPGGAVPAKKIFGIEHVRQFLDEQLGISSAFIEHALFELTRKGSGSILNVQLTRREARRLGLA